MFWSNQDWSGFNTRWPMPEETPQFWENPATLHYLTNALGILGRHILVKPFGDSQGLIKSLITYSWEGVSIPCSVSSKWIVTVSVACVPFLLKAGVGFEGWVQVNLSEDYCQGLNLGASLLSFWRHGHYSYLQLILWFVWLLYPFRAFVWQPSLKSVAYHFRDRSLIGHNLSIIY